MKQWKWDDRYGTIALYAAGLCSFAVLCVFVGLNLDRVVEWIGRMMNVMAPVSMGFVIAYLVNPLMKFCEKHIFVFLHRKKRHARLVRVLSMLTAYLFFAMLLTVLLMMVIPQVMISYNDLLKRMSDYLSSLQDFVGRWFGDSAWLDVEKMTERLRNWISDWYQILQNIAPHITAIVGELLSHLRNVVIGLVISVYFLFSKEHLVAQCKKFTYAVFRKKRAEYLIEFMRFTDKTFGGFIIGKLLDSLIFGLLTFLVLAIFRIPYYPLVSVIVGVTNVIPFFGPFIGAIPSSLIIFIADPMKALWFCVLILIIQQLDGNVIGPKILGDSIGMSALGIILAITLMGGLLGIAGMFIGVPLYALLLEIGKRLFRRLRHWRGMEAANEGPICSSGESESRDDQGPTVSQVNSETSSVSHNEKEAEK